MLKGKACINCRRRKIKCDGEKPSCGQCSRSNGAFEDCEYPGAGPTQTQILADRISHLQVRIRELENKEPINLPLHHPYNEGSSKKPLRDAAVLPGHRPNSKLPSLKGSPSTSSRNAVSSKQCREPPVAVAMLLIDAFFHHCTRLGFFFNVERFRQYFPFPMSGDPHARPTPALLYTIYMWGAHLLLPSEHEDYDEKTFLRNALHHISSDLSSSHPYRIIHSLQAEILLSYYYLKHGKVLGGNYHANSAVSIALSSGLHRLRSFENTPIMPVPANSPRIDISSLPPPRDDMEESERTNAFWVVLILNSYWISIQESHSMFYDLQNISVNTSCQLDVGRYQLQLLPRVNSNTVKEFLEKTSLEGITTTALLAKSAILLEQATVLRTSTPNDFENIASTRSPGFIRLNTLIEQFKGSFQLLDQMYTHPSDIETLYLLKIMTHVAKIKLHLPLSDNGNELSRQEALISAQAIAVLSHNVLPTSSLKTDPIIGVLWTAACEVLIHELMRPNSLTTGENPQWSALLHLILTQMNKFSTNNIFMKFLVHRLQKNHPAALPAW